MSASQNLILQDLQKLQELREQLDLLSSIIDYRLPDEPFQQELEKAVNQMHAALEVIAETTLRIDRTVEFIAADVAELLPDDKRDFQNYMNALRIYSANLPYLAIYGSLGKKPRKLDDIFVKPPLRASNDKKSRTVEEELVTIVGQVLCGDNPKHLFIRGQPGSGKSTLLRWIANHAFDAPSMVGLNQSCLPMVINLRFLSIVEGISVEDKLRNSLSKASELVLEGNLSAGFFERWPAYFRHPWIIMFDGLDEIPNDRYEATVQWIQNAMETLQRSGYYIIITSRITHGLPIILEKQFADYEILPFEQRLQRQLLKRWFAAWTDKQADAFLGDLKNRQAESLASTPLLLTVAASVYEQDGNLPERRTSLYERYLAINFREADKRGLRDELGIDMFDVGEHGLEHIALQVTENPEEESVETMHSAIAHYLREALNLSEDVAEKRSKRFVEIMGRRSGILVCQGDRCEWSHSTFREYLAARLMVREHFNDAGCSDFAAIERVFTRAGTTELWNFMIEQLEDKKRLGDANWQDVCLHALQCEFSLALRYYRKIKRAPEEYVISPVLITSEF